MKFLTFVLCFCLFGLVLPQKAEAQVEIFRYGFETFFPSGTWIIGDETASNGLDFWRDIYLGGGAHTGNWAGWCAATGDSGGISNLVRGTYDINMDAYARFTVDLSAPGSYDLQYYYKIPSIEFIYDRFEVQVSGDGSSWSTYFSTSSSTFGSWYFNTHSLSAFVGDPTVYIRFFFHSDVSNTAEGAYIDDIVVTRTCPSSEPLSSGFAISRSSNPGLYQYYQTAYNWAVVGVRPPSTSDWDLKLYGDACFSTDSLKAISAAGQGFVDYIVADYHYIPSLQYDYPLVQFFNGTGPYRLEWENGSDVLSFPYVSPQYSWSAGTVVKIWDVYLSAGQTVVCSVKVLNGTTFDPGLALFRPTGQPYFAGRYGGAVATAGSNGPGQSEGFTYNNVPSSGNYGLVLHSNNEDYGVYTIQVQPPCPTDPLTSGVVTNTNLNPGQFNYNQIYQKWSVVGLRPPSGDNWNLGIYDDACFTVSRKASTEAGNLLDFVVADYHHTPLGSDFARTNLFSGSGIANYSLEWEDGTEVLQKGYIPLVWNTGHVTAIWDLSLNPGDTLIYAVEVDSASQSFDPGIALFKSPGTMYFARRTEALANADTKGPGRSESFKYGVPGSTPADDYGLVVWSNSSIGGNSWLVATIKGDMNGDGERTVADVVKMLSCVFSYDPIEYSAYQCFYSVGDMNCDGNFTPTDIVLELNRIFSGTPLPC